MSEKSEKDRAPGVKSAYELALERLESQGIERPREESARWAEQGVGEFVVTARTTNDIDALVGAVDRW